MAADRQPSYFAAVGDVHGHMSLMANMLRTWEQISGNSLRFVLQVGDFEPHRDEADLATMAAPAKYRTLGDFHAYNAGEVEFDWPVYFIGGNHEPYGFLDQLAPGAEIVRRCHYLGRAGRLEIEGQRVAGLSGIHREDMYEAPRPSAAEIGTRSKKDYIHFNKADVDAMADLGQTDILLLHEWPEDIIAAEDRDDFENTRRAMRYDCVGNEYARLLMEILEPSLVLCGHMHRRYRSTVTLQTGKRVQVCCLASVPQGYDAIAIQEFTTDGQYVEVPLPSDLTRGWRSRK